MDGSVEAWEAPRVSSVRAWQAPDKAAGPSILHHHCTPRTAREAPAKVRFARARARARAARRQAAWQAGAALLGPACARALRRLGRWYNACAQQSAPNPPTTRPPSARPQLDASRTPAPTVAEAPAEATRDAFFAAAEGYNRNKARALYGTHSVIFG